MTTFNFHSAHLNLIVLISDFACFTCFHWYIGLNNLDNLLILNCFVPSVILTICLSIFIVLRLILVWPIEVVLVRILIRCSRDITMWSIHLRSLRLIIIIRTVPKFSVLGTIWNIPDVDQILIGCFFLFNNIHVAHIEAQDKLDQFIFWQFQTRMG